jgi:hypothetical protein
MVFCYGNMLRSFFRPSSGQRFCELIVWKTGLGVGFNVPRSGKNWTGSEWGLVCCYDRKLAVILLLNINTAVIARGAPKGGNWRGGGATGLRPTSNWNFKTDFVDTMVLNVLHDLSFIQKSAPEIGW